LPITKTLQRAFIAGLAAQKKTPRGSVTRSSAYSKTAALPGSEPTIGPFREYCVQPSCHPAGARAPRVCQRLSVCDACLTAQVLITFGARRCADARNACSAACRHAPARQACGCGVRNGFGSPVNVRAGWGRPWARRGCWWHRRCNPSRMRPNTLRMGRRE